VLEHTRLGQLAQLGVDVAAAQRGDDRRVDRLDRLRDAEGRVDRARERHRHQHERRPVALDRGQRQLAQQFVDEGGRRRQRIGQRVEGGLAERQALGVAHELETRVDRLADHVGDVVQVQRGQVSGVVLRTERAEGPGERAAAVGVLEGIERREARAFGQEGAAADAVRQRGVAALQKRQRRRDGGGVTGVVGLEGLHPRRALGGGQRGDARVHAGQAVARQQFQRQRQRQILLHRVDPARAQEAGQVGGRRIRGVELRHRRDDGQDTNGLGRHGGFGAGIGRFSALRLPWPA